MSEPSIGQPGQSSRPQGPRAVAVSVIVPTFNEAPNVAALVERIESAVSGRRAEVIFVDDSTDQTPGAILTAASTSSIPIRLIHRERAEGGLGGAVVVGLREASHDWCVVMDGDLQHPPELIPALLTSGVEQRADLVIASRHITGGSSKGLGGGLRHLVSTASTLLTRAMFPRKLRDCTDPMTGFFAIRSSSIDLSQLHPRGFKILLEILARNSLRVAEEPFVFADRAAGRSKASAREGVRFVMQLAALRFGRLSSFAVIGAVGAVANIAIMAALQAVGTWYLLAAVVAALVTIAANFVLQERFVFHDLRAEGRSVWLRLAQSMTFNLSETALRTFLLWAIVETTVAPTLVVQAALIAIGFIIRFVYQSRIVYKPKRSTSIGFDLDAAELHGGSLEVVATPDDAPK